MYGLETCSPLILALRCMWLPVEEDKEEVKEEERRTRRERKKEREEAMEGNCNGHEKGKG